MCNPTQIPLPTPPTWDQGSITSSLLAEFVYIGQLLGYSILNLFLGLFSEIGCGLGGIAQSAIYYVQASWNDATAGLAGFGIFAPIIAPLIFGTGILILVVFVWLLVRVSTSEGKNEVNEVEEGA